MISQGEKVNQYLRHATSDPLIQFYMSNGGETRIMSLPICPKCERTGLRDQGWSTKRTMACPHCGYRGPATLQLSAYLSNGEYR